MKKIFITILSVVFAANVFAQETKTTITLSVSKFSKGLVERWISDYEKQNENVEIRIVSGKAAQNADLVVTGNEVAADRDAVAVAKYALLPVTAIENPLYSELQDKELGEKDLKHLFFELSAEEKLYRRGKALWTDQFKVVSGSGKNAGAAIYAKYFGHEAADFRGNRIAGDDLYLLSALNEDKEQITINNLTYIYDLESRQLKSDLTILPLKLKKRQETALQSGNLDAVIELLEEEDVDLIPVARLNVVVAKASTEANNFLSFILGDGQQANHDFGFLQLDYKLAQVQSTLISTRLASK